MSFELKNAGATYQRCMNRCLGELVMEVIKVYIDDIIVKSKKADQLVSNLDAAFSCLWEFRIKLNPKKICLRGSQGEAPWVHHLRTRHQSQLRENYGDREPGPYLEPKGSPEAYGMPGFS
jgi:hypothetical protein